MDLNLNQGPVTVRMVNSGPSFELYQATQGEVKCGAIRFDWTKNGVILETIVGHGHAVYAPLVTKRFNAALALGGRTTQLVDFWAMPTYDSDLRIAHTGWGGQRRTAIDGIHILIQSKLAAMGVSVANLAMGGILKSYTARGEFDILASKLGLPARRPMPE